MQDQRSSSSNIILRKKVLELYASKSVDAPTLNRKIISQLVNKFRQEGTVNNLPHHRIHTALTLETLALLSRLLFEMPNKSRQRVAKEQNVSYSTVHCAIGALQLHPYHIRVTHKLSLLDPNQRLHYCNWLLTNFMPALTQPTLLYIFLFFR